jgi:hypothetical protein
VKDSFPMFKRCAEHQLMGRPPGLYIMELVTNLWPGAFVQHEHRQSLLLTTKDDVIHIDPAWAQEMAA